MKILYVEDEADIREIAAFALEDEGFEIEFCESGERALDTAKTFHPDMILLDVMMPGMDGPTTLENLRKLPGLESTPVIFLTAKVQPREVQQLFELGAVEVIAKPFDPMKLADQIRTISSQNT
jgi:CheY-like chemotaxis protein